MNTTLRMKIVLPPPSAGEAQAGGVSGPARTSGSTDPHEFLAMRARQRAARARARRWKRAGLALCSAALVAGFLVLPRWRRRAISALAPVAAAVVRPPAVAVPAPVSAVPAQTVAPAVNAVAVEETAAARCEDDFSRLQWRSAIDSCTQAFQETPTASLALRVAHAQWSHGEVTAAGAWATKSVALGTEDPDAYVLIGHSEREAGHREAAIAAYRRYLRRAPHGWHADRVRAALRQLRPRPAAGDAVTAVEPASAASE
jgi:hypothetical protein